MMVKPLAIWALTPRGAHLARQSADRLTPADMFLPERMAANRTDVYWFKNLKEAVAQNFSRYSGHIFIMATGIVVRAIAPLLIHKTKDPAVVVMDETGKFAISLLSGHIGGANALAVRAAKACGGQAVITTATDLNEIAAIDLLAKNGNLKIENPEAIKAVNMALLTGEQIALYDPYQQIDISSWPVAPKMISGDSPADQVRAALCQAAAGVLIDDLIWRDLPQSVLVLRPPILVAGMGCNRNTSAQELRDLLETLFRQCNLAPASLYTIASIDLKADEPGLLELARQLNLELTFFTRAQLAQITDVPSPSAVVDKHIGVNSVCEAAAILGARRGSLIAAKHKSLNATLAIARRDFTSSASVRAA